jgi:hypothetical protein
MYDNRCCVLNLCWIAAKQRQPLSENEKEFLRYFESNYVGLKNVYLEEG